MLKGFRDFILRGNVLDLAVGVIIGAAFTAVTTSLAQDVLTPLIALIFGNPDYSNVTIGPIKIGNLINAIISFLITDAFCNPPVHSTGTLTSFLITDASGSVSPSIFSAATPASIHAFRNTAPVTSLWNSSRGSR